MPSWAQQRVRPTAGRTFFYLASRSAGEAVSPVAATQICVEGSAERVITPPRRPGKSVPRFAQCRGVGAPPAPGFARTDKLRSLLAPRARIMRERAMSAVIDSGREGC